MDNRQALEIELGSEKLLPLLEDYTFKALFGGRAGMKSYVFADLHIAMALRYASRDSGGYRALCLREVQNSIKESSKRLLEQRIQYHGLGDMFEVQDQVIKAPNGGIFTFHGLQNHTAESVKSFEGFDVADIEEAQTLSQRSIDLLVPTIIRKAGAQIWARWNPRHKTDAIDIMFRGDNPPPNSVCIQIGYQDNPWLSDEVLTQIESDYEANPEKAEHIWGGGYDIVTEGAYFAKLIAQASKEGRIGNFPYDPSLRVMTGWDIGVDDYTAIWFFQHNGLQVRAIDYYEVSGEGAPEIVRAALPEVLPKSHALYPFVEVRPQDFRYSRHYLPHDVKVREWGGGAKTRLQTLKELGVRPIHVGVAQGPVERIAASRALMPMMHFDDNPRVQLGLDRLRKYSRKFNKLLGTYGSPLHDENSHPADAFGEFAVNCGIRPKARPMKNKPRPKDYRGGQQQENAGWR